MKLTKMKQKEEREERWTEWMEGRGRGRWSLLLCVQDDVCGAGVFVCRD